MKIVNFIKNLFRIGKSPDSFNKKSKGVMDAFSKAIHSYSEVNKEIRSEHRLLQDETTKLLAVVNKKQGDMTSLMQTVTQNEKMMSKIEKFISE